MAANEEDPPSREVPPVDTRHGRGVQVGADNAQQNFFINVSRRTIGRNTAITVLAMAAALAIISTVAIQGKFEDPSRSSGKPAANLSPRPAPSSSPPVLVENVTAIESISGDGSFVLPRPLDMTSNDLKQFNAKVVVNSSAFSSWYTDHDGAAVDFGVTTVTLRGNAREAVRVADMKVIKDCHRPFNGSFFQGYTQGDGDTVRIGIDLDSPEPVPQEMALTAARGLHPLGNSFFAVRTIELAPGETETLSIGAFTKHYACAFSLQIIVATSHGAFSQDINYRGRPFEVTAKAAPTDDGLPFSGYRTAYARIARNGNTPNWEQINPATSKGQ
jgi:hypothetical protein